MGDIIVKLIIYIIKVMYNFKSTQYKFSKSTILWKKNITCNMIPKVIGLIILNIGQFPK